MSITRLGPASIVLVCLVPAGCGDSGSPSAAPTAPSGPPTVILAASTANAFVGQPITLTWSSTNATSCAASGGWSGALATSGSQSVTATGAGVVTFSILCTGSGGSASASSAVTATTPAVSVTNTFSPNAVTISTSEGAPYGDGDLWTHVFDHYTAKHGYGPTKVIRLYICLSGQVGFNLCSQAPTPTGALSDQMLAGIDAGIGAYAGSGARLMIRFTYNFGGNPTDRDAPIDIISKHIDQLAPILLKHKDLIFALEAGFIGQWGEWHQSTNGNDTPAAHKIVLDKELSYFSGAFPVLVRYAGALITYSGTLTPPAGVGLHDDYYASSPNDGFTFDPTPPINAAFTPCVQPNNFLGFCLPNYTQSQLMSYAAQVSTSTMYVGEIGALYSPLQTCAALDAFSYQLHVQSISIETGDYVGVGPVLESNGCATSFLNKVGTRIELQRASLIGNPSPGGSLFVSLTMANAGYGRVIRPRPATLVFTSDGSVVAQTSINLQNLDLRQLISTSPPTPKTFQFTVAAPATLPVGKTIGVALLISDPAPSLALLPAYALPLNSLDASGRPDNERRMRRTLSGGDGRPGQCPRPSSLGPKSAGVAPYTAKPCSLKHWECNQRFL